MLLPPLCLTSWDAFFQHLAASKHASSHCDRTAYSFPRLTIRPSSRRHSICPHFANLSWPSVFMFSSQVEFRVWLFVSASVYCFSSDTRRKMWLLCVLLLSLLSLVSGAADSKAITTTLTTKWANTPLLLEARYHTVLLEQLFHCIKCVTIF